MAVQNIKANFAVKRDFDSFFLGGFFDTKSMNVPETVNCLIIII